MDKVVIGSNSNIEINFDPSKYKTPASAAKAFYRAIAKLNKKYGLNENEVILMNPKRAEEYSGIKAWAVVWEAGPYEWAIEASFEVYGPWGHAEPYYSFDLHFFK